MTNLTKSLALEFLELINKKELDHILEHPFFTHLLGHPGFKEGIKKTMKYNSSITCEPSLIFDLAPAIARAIISFNDFSDTTFNAATKHYLKPHIRAIEETLSSSMAFPCEFEQSLFLSLLEELESATTPARGHKTKGDAKNSQQRKMLKELNLSLQDCGIGTTPTVIISFASIIDESVEYKTVVSQLSKKNTQEAKDWRTYSETFLNLVYAPYCQFRSTFKDK